MSEPIERVSPTGHSTWTFEDDTDERYPRNLGKSAKSAVNNAIEDVEYSDLRSSKVASGLIVVVEVEEDE
jgi:hypothetical protein